MRVHGMLDQRSTPDGMEAPDGLAYSLWMEHCRTCFRMSAWAAKVLAQHCRSYFARCFPPFCFTWTSFQEGSSLRQKLCSSSQRVHHRRPCQTSRSHVVDNSRPYLVPPKSWNHHGHKPGKVRVVFNPSLDSAALHYTRNCIKVLIYLHHSSEFCYASGCYPM